MNSLAKYIYQKLYNQSNEFKRTLPPSYDILKKYDSYEIKNNSKVILSFAAGRSGQNWISKIFNSHNNWIGTCERYRWYESFSRYVKHNNLKVDLTSFYKLFELSIKYDVYRYNNTFIASPYFANDVIEITNNLNPSEVCFNIRHPIESVISLYNCNLYSEDYFYEKDHDLAIVDISKNLYKSFSRITPNGEFRKEWLSLTRIGKITWFWAYLNSRIYEDFNNISDVKKIVLKLEDINNNYDFYQNLVEAYSFENKLNKKQFSRIKYKSSNSISNKKYKYVEWTKQEKLEFEYIINSFFPYYDLLKSDFI